MDKLKCLIHIRRISSCIFVGALGFNIYNYLNHIENAYSHYIFWVALFTFMASNTWINSIRMKNRK
ncbi:hypothetical protein QJR26_19050 (plasmid) [Clostridium baratii]